jgi:nucleoside-diphosphate-sugar epimerase
MSQRSDKRQSNPSESCQVRKVASLLTEALRENESVESPRWRIGTATRVLVTGGGGFIGHHLVKYLVEKGYWVRAVDIKSRRKAEAQS